MRRKMIYVEFSGVFFFYIFMALSLTSSCNEKYKMTKYALYLYSWKRNAKHYFTFTYIIYIKLKAYRSTKQHT